MPDLRLLGKRGGAFHVTNTGAAGARLTTAQVQRIKRPFSWHAFHETPPLFAIIEISSFGFFPPPATLCC